METSIRVQDIHYAYGKQKAVNGISFDVAAGEVLGFLGPNGAGKSTTIKMLTGQLIAQKGDIEILGIPVKGHSSEVHALIGVSFEEKNLYFQMSAVENLKFFASLYGIKKPPIYELLEKVDLVDRAKDRVSSYSKGMRQRLMIARALINNPQVMFLDEPTDGLDPVSAKAIREIIRDQAKNGTAILLTTHDMNEADKLSDRVAFINEGKLYALDTAENLKLKHGSRTALIRVRKGDVIQEIQVPLDDRDVGQQIQKAILDTEIITLHTEEASLEDVFISMTGRRL